MREAEAQVAGKVTEDVHKKQLLVSAAGVPFYNRSRYSLPDLLKNFADNQLLPALYEHRPFPRLVCNIGITLFP